MQKLDDHVSEWFVQMRARNGLPRITLKAAKPPTTSQI